MQSMTNDTETRISGSPQDELTGRLLVADKRCPICHTELASPTNLIAHVHREHCHSLRSTPNKPSVVDGTYERILEENYTWMRQHLDEELIERLQARMAESQERRQQNSEVDDGGSVTKDVTAKVDGRGMGFRLVLCTYVDHYGSGAMDAGWGCGYRNTQMLLSCLMKRGDYKQRLMKFWEGRNVDGDLIPSIPHLQLFIQKAWAEGFDEIGAQQLGHSLVGTKKWIGATEIATLLSYLKIHCLLVDFHIPTGPNSTHPELFKWVKMHFRNGTQNGFVAPLILQHQGHSRTIIGVEEEGNGVINLMLLDPSWSKQKLAELESPEDSCLRLLRVGSSNLKAEQYQIVAVSGTILTDSEYENEKILKSLRIP